ncbi:tetratricopeptide repeat protein [Corallococcus llansteffanensis]|uniref:tetratricopeptide repeat protein n=1 Tax=Corallococcus llansteffanensis TaxID=2316731 RepID=UPI0011C37265|nr:tetratricopeptide repeat protein [Corallococcus llansteffanensis]
MDSKGFLHERHARRLASTCSRRLLGTLLLSLTVLPSLQATAQEQGRVQPYLLSVRRLYENLEYERALEQLSRAKRLSSGKEEDVLLSLYEGAILADLGRVEESEAAFKAALFVRPEAKLPVLVSPKVEERFEAVRRQVKQKLEAVARGQADAPVQVPPPEAPPTPVPDAPHAPALAPEAFVARTSSGQGRRTGAWLPATIGGGLLVGGGVCYLLARAEHSKLRGSDAGLATREDVKRSASRGKRYQWMGVGLAGAGVVGLGVSAGVYLLGRPSQARTLGVDVSTDGTSAFVQGRWP